MADGTIGVDEPVTIDLNVDTENLGGVPPKHRERIQVSGAVLAEIARVLNANPASTDYGLVVRTAQGFAAATPMFTDPIDRALRDMGKIDIAGFDVALPTGANTIGAVTGPTADNAANPTAKLSVLAGVANAAAPTRTEGNVNPLRLNLAGDVAVTLDGEAVVLGAGAAVIGALTANQSVNVAQIAGAATVTSAAGVQRVGIAGSGNAVLDAAIAAAVPSQALLKAGRAATANPTNATGGNLVAVMCDKAGRVVVTKGQVRELIGIQQTAVAATAETTIITAGAAGVFNDLVALIITTAGAAAQTITIKDATAGTTRFVLNYPNAALAPGAPFILCLGFAIPQAAAAANWTVTQSLTTACNYTAVFLKNL